MGTTYPEGVADDGGCILSVAIPDGRESDTRKTKKERARVGRAAMTGGRGRCADGYVMVYVL